MMSIVLHALEEEGCIMPGKAIVCDDQAIVREILGGYLKRKGYEITTAKDGEECLALVKEADFDVVFLDIQMPKLDGISVMREIERLKIKIQVILRSGLDHPQVNEDETPDTTAFLSKPFSLENVMQALTKLPQSSVSKILVVDDQDMLREMLTEFLSGEGYDIVEACNGKECVDRAQEQPFDAIFMDVRMPEMDGLEALKKLRENGIKSPVFLMSGFGDVNSVEDARERGAQNFLPKPFKLDRALELLHSNES